MRGCYFDRTNPKQPISRETRRLGGEASSSPKPELAGDIETLTQRYWECMLSRIVMLGHAPQELIDLIGYNPVIEIDKEHVKEPFRRGSDASSRRPD